VLLLKTSVRQPGGRHGDERRWTGGRDQTHQTGSRARWRAPVTTSLRVVTFAVRGVASVRSSRVAADRSAVAVGVYLSVTSIHPLRIFLFLFPPAPAVVGISPFLGEDCARARTCTTSPSSSSSRRRCHRRSPRVSAICTSRGVYHGGRDVGEAAGGAARQRVLVKSSPTAILLRSSSSLAINCHRAATPRERRKCDLESRAGKSVGR
jgi:hypothetical protein